MTIAYLDASVLVAFFTTDRFSDRAEVLLQSQTSGVLVSNFAAAEFASVLARLVRTKDMDIPAARTACSTFDSWVAKLGARTEIGGSDITAAEAMLRRFDLTLRSPDAIHLAAAQRLGARLATFDTGLARCADAVGVDVVLA
jgi:uncharacterized protein